MPAKFSYFRVAWECTPEAERKPENLVSRLIREEKRISEDEVSTLAFHVQKMTVKGLLEIQRYLRHHYKVVEGVAPPTK